MKAGWELKTLGEVCDFKGGSQPPKSEFINEPKPGYVRMLQIRDFKSDDKAVYIPITDKTNQCAETDIMIGRYGASVGQIHRGKSGAYNVALIRTIPDKKHIDQDYLYHYLTSDLFQKPLMSVSKRGAQDGFSKPDIAPFQIPLPPLEEQKRIVSILDEAFEGLDRARENAEANLKSARELFDTTFNTLLTSTKDEVAAEWSISSLGELCENLDSKRVPITKNQRVEGPIPYYGASGIVDYVQGHLFNEPLLLISEDGANLLARTYPIAFSIKGKTWVNNHAHVLRFDTAETRRFVELYLNSIPLDPYISGMAQPKLNQKKLTEIPIPIPNLLEQRRIIGLMDKCSDGYFKLESSYQTKLQDISDLRQSLLQKAFAGELT